MQSSSFPQSHVGLPQSLNFALPPSLPESARAYSVHLSPDGITSVTGPQVVAPFDVNHVAAGNFGNFSSQVVSFTIPSGMGDSVFIDTNSTTLSFTLSYTVTTASVLTGGCNLIGSAASFFDSLVVYSNNTPLESINSYGLLQNFLLNNTVSLSEKAGGLSVSMGCDTNTMTGIDIGTSVAQTFRYNFCIPLCSVIGYNCSDKLFPIGSVNNMQLQMTTAQVAPIVTWCTAFTTQPVFSTGLILSEFQLNLKYIDVGDIAAALLRQTLQDGKWMIKATTYTNSAVTIPIGSSGSQQLLLQIRNSSVKSVLHQFGTTQTDRCPNYYYDSFNPCLNSRQLQVGGQYFPNKPINDLQRGAEGYQYLIQALSSGGGIAKAVGTVVDRQNYCVTVNAVPAGSDSSYVQAGVYLRPAAPGNNDGNTNIISYPNMFYCGYDLEKSSNILFQGVNTRSTPPFLNLNIASAVATNTITCQAWGMSDVILVFDLPSKSVQAFI